MAIAGSPKKLAQDIAEGYFMLTPPLLKNYTPADLKIIVVNIAIVTRELRQEVIQLDDVMAIKARNMKFSRLHQADVVIQAFCRKKRCPL
ncbi:MAG: hypothetical protein CVU66_00875 [Deltaproteobacteria bacterium HGW-Deltaproteobacteria-23]|nr:MAG: hypothetical protein CVU66_00875 [Deltaproteobacteria bacterium HGW-Deltaproteobacteria-23]